MVQDQFTLTPFGSHGRHCDPWAYPAAFRNIASIVGSRWWKELLQLIFMLWRSWPSAFLFWARSMKTTHGWAKSWPRVLLQFRRSCNVSVMVPRVASTMWTTGNTISLTTTACLALYVWSLSLLIPVFGKHMQRLWRNWNLVLWRSQRLASQREQIFF